MLPVGKKTVIVFVERFGGCLGIGFLIFKLGCDVSIKLRRWACLRFCRAFKSSYFGDKYQLFPF